MEPIVLVKNDLASVEFSEAGGVGALKISVNASLGGGATAGVVKAVASAEVDLSAKQLVDASFDLAAAKYPAAAAAIAIAKGLVDEEFSKI